MDSSRKCPLVGFKSAQASHSFVAGASEIDLRYVQLKEILTKISESIRFSRGTGGCTPACVGLQPEEYDLYLSRPEKMRELDRGASYYGDILVIKSIGASDIQLSTKGDL